MSESCPRRGPVPEPRPSSGVEQRRAKSVSDRIIRMAKSSASKKSLVIVESPAKAKTINKYLGPDYEVKASMGHVRDLPSKGLNVDIENNFEPTYDIMPGKKRTVTSAQGGGEEVRQALSGHRP